MLYMKSNSTHKMDTTGSGVTSKGQGDGSRQEIFADLPGKKEAMKKMILEKKRRKIIKRKGKSKIEG